MKYKQKYRISSIRIKDYDYSDNGSYFVTICTENRKSFFGKIANDKMHYYPSGKIASEIWHDIPKYFSDIELANWVVMPNHVHGILTIDKFYRAKRDAINRVSTGKNNVLCRDAIYRVSAYRVSAYRVSTGGITGDKNPMLGQSLSRIIRWYKGRTTFEIRKQQPHFSWQTRFYEHVIRNEKEYQEIAYYIDNNPLNWKKDNYFKSTIE